MQKIGRSFGGLVSFALDLTDLTNPQLINTIRNIGNLQNVSPSDFLTPPLSLGRLPTLAGLATHVRSGTWT